ncbi:MAG: ATP-binding cassette domain-containing protein [Chloroflexaceae bacterium]
MSIIVTEGLSKTFQVDKSTTVEAVKDVNLCVEQGEIFGFLGPNGAGKSTMIRMMTTLLPPSRGLATVTNYDLQKEPAQIRQNIGVVGQFLQTLGRLNPFSHAVDASRALATGELMHTTVLPSFVLFGILFGLMFALTVRAFRHSVH